MAETSSGAPRSTRRSLLAAGAGALAAGVLRPHAALAALAPAPSPSLSERALGTLGPGATTLSLRACADLLGVQWRGPRHARVQVRFRTPRGRWSRWASAGSHGHGAEGEPRGGEVIGDPVWTGGTRELQLRSSEPIESVRVHLVDVSRGRGARAQAAIAGAFQGAAALATPVLAAGAGQPPIIARSAWAGASAPPRVAPGYGAVHMAFVHHTENPNGYGPAEVPAMLLAIYAFHRYVRGWNDIGYNFVVDLFGRVFEARAGGIDEPVVGAHAGGFNLSCTGVAVLGTFTGVPISEGARETLQRLLAWKLSLHGVPALGVVRVRVNPAGAVYARFPAGAHVRLPRIAGHRDGDSTDCPGDVLYGELPGIRNTVRALAPRPTVVTLALAPPAAGAPPAGVAPGAGSAPAAPGSPEGAQPVPATLAGTVSFLDGTPIAGAGVLVQARFLARRGERVSERTLAQLSADPQGRFSLPAQFAGVATRALWVRALCPGGPGFGAGVSRAVRVRVSPAPAPPGAATTPGAGQPGSSAPAPAPGAPAPTPTAPAPPAP